MNLAGLDAKVHVALGNTEFDEVLFHCSQHWFRTTNEEEQVLVILWQDAGHQVSCDVTGVGPFVQRFSSTVKVSG